MGILDNWIFERYEGLPRFLRYVLVNGALLFVWIFISYELGGFR